ncbi:MAG: UDP-N-acetylmuramate--L-alanine ligase [Elusimicrobia bacterium CG08_land_8_20_14_0_20_44_26]|nr:MAG: UDP-N-acetylmuramate--L-alanine ligase [Elusimicrobia bacterium CG08_land_8_20_14_0_20_44_26]
MLSGIRNIHFVGIGGTGMSGIAEVLKRYGYTITGSDIVITPVTRRLASMGCKIFTGHRSSNVKNAHVVVYSSAVNQENIEVVAAAKNNIPVIQRAEMLGELMRIKYGIAIAGSHGKTSTTSMVSQILSSAGYDPTMVIGGLFKNIGTGGYKGSGDFLVAEADESDASFLRLSPVLVAVTNIDDDHLNFYGNMDNLKQTFVDFINSVPFYGMAFLCIDDVNVAEILPQLRKKYFTYGFSDKADYVIKILETGFFNTKYEINFRGRRAGSLTVPLPGLHNVLNSALAACICLNLGVALSKIKIALKGYMGVSRRFDVRGVKNGIIVIDDYAHHPTEVKMTVRTARETWPDKRIVVLFQPHRYTRTKEQAWQLGRSFDRADAVCILPIYSAGEEKIPGITSQLIWENIPRTIRKKMFSSIDEASEILAKMLKKNDVFITVGAGDVYKVGESILKKLK